MFIPFLDGVSINQPFLGLPMAMETPWTCYDLLHLPAASKVLIGMRWVSQEATQIHMAVRSLGWDEPRFVMTMTNIAIWKKYGHLSEFSIVFQ